jgi:hypothetical protein
MSSPIWTRVALPSEFRSFEGHCWRLVEAQHVVSTLKLTDTLDEQSLLEGLLEETKPAVPQECSHLDFLLSTPFRYGTVYPAGSRFRRAGRTPGVFYGAEAIETAIAEMAFYRLLFFSESPGTPYPANAPEFTAFSVELASPRLLDLTAEPLSADAELWDRPVDYAACQSFAEAARAADADIIRYASVRAPARGACLAILRCRSFAKPSPTGLQTWRMKIDRSGVQALSAHPRMALEFPRETFAADPRLAAQPR